MFSFINSDSETKRKQRELLAEENVPCSRRSERGDSAKRCEQRKKTTRGWCEGVLRAALHYPNAWNRLKKICHRLSQIFGFFYLYFRDSLLFKFSEYIHTCIELCHATMTTSFQWSEMARLTVELKIEWLPEVNSLMFWDLGNAEAER